MCLLRQYISRLEYQVRHTQAAKPDCCDGLDVSPGVSHGGG